MVKTFEPRTANEVGHFTSISERDLPDCFAEYVPPSPRLVRQHPHKESLKSFCQQFRALKEDCLRRGSEAPTHRAAQRLFGLLWEATKKLPSIPKNGKLSVECGGGLQVVWRIQNTDFVLHISGSDVAEDYLTPSVSNTDLSYEILHQWLMMLIENTNMKTLITQTNSRVAAQTHQNAPQRKTLGLRPGPKRQNHQEAMAATFAQYDQALRVLAGLQSAPSH